MDDIAPLYINDIGIVFYWKREGKLLSHRMQLVFRDTGFYLTEEELMLFSDHIREAVRWGCKGCPAGCQQKRRLTTPYPQIELAVSALELQLLEDLVEGAVFRLRLLDFVNGVGLN